ncbi:MAG: hypothetical protein DRN16_00125 [Thermoplasmata archaeon]|nr:MAG: hypothetical protein DRN16_00125 [Thermoplasmata archaeon]
MRKLLFAITAAFLMILTVFGCANAVMVKSNKDNKGTLGPDGTIYGTVFGMYENDWGEDVQIPLAGVKVTITRSDGDSRTVYTDANGYFSHTVNFEKYDRYTIETETIEGVVIDGKKYKFYSTAENAVITWWDTFVNAKKVDILMPGKEMKDKSLSLTNTQFLKIINTLHAFFPYLFNKF